MMLPGLNPLMIGLSRYWALVVMVVVVAVCAQNVTVDDIAFWAATAAIYPAAIPVFFSVLLLALFYVAYSVCGTVFGSEESAFDAGSQFFFQTPPPEPGAVGLHNLGNSCYMSCSLTCVSNCAPVAAYFLSGAYARHVNQSNVSGTQGRVSRAYAALLKSWWLGNRAAISPASFKVRLRCVFSFKLTRNSCALSSIILPPFLS